MKTNVSKVLVLGGLLASSMASATDAEMVTLFKANKCNECHSLSKYNVKAEPEEGKKNDDDEGKPIDLTSEKRAPEHDITWTIKYLKKKEKIKEKKHKKRWPGDDKDLDVIAAWLDANKAK